MTALPKRHTLIPNGPMKVGCMDLMYGKDKNGTLLRLFYPTDLQTLKDENGNGWTKVFLDEKYGEGTSKFITKYFQSIYKTVMNMKTKNLYVPAVWEHPISKKKKFPIIVYSHGLCANRSMYNSICSDLASYGFVVAAVEHRDKSASATFTLSETGEKEWILIDTGHYSHSNRTRNEQVKIRATECSRTLDLLDKLNKGETINNEFKSCKFDLQTLKDSLDLTHPVIAGQSFGGATVLQTLYQDKRFELGMSLDPWLFPLKKELCKMGPSIEQPILFVLMEGFQNKTNLDALKFFAKDKNTMVTVKNSSHLNQTDAIYIIENSWMMWMVDMGTNSIDRELALQINNNIMLQFISKHLKDTLIGKYNAELLEKSAEHFVYDAQGTAKFMVGWGFSDKLEENPVVTPESHM